MSLYLDTLSQFWAKQSLFCANYFCQKDWSTGTKVIARKPLCLQMDDKILCFSSDILEKKLYDKLGHGLHQWHFIPVTNLNPTRLTVCLKPTAPCVGAFLKACSKCLCASEYSNCADFILPEIRKQIIQWNLSKVDLIGTNIFVWNRQVFIFYMLNSERFPTLGLYSVW